MSQPPSHLRLVPLLAAGHARREQTREQIRALLSVADFDLLARDLAERRLLPLIGSRAIDAAPDLVPVTFQDAVTTARAHARAHALAIETATRRAVGALESAGIRALPLKGPLLAAEAHGDTGLRGTADVDVLVAPQALDRAAGALTVLGYGPPEGRRRANGLPDLHLELRHPALAPIDLHWRVHWYESAFSERVLHRATPGADGLLRAQPDDLAALLLLFHARDGFHGVRVAADLAAWWDRHGDSLPPHFLAEHLRSYPELARPLAASARAVERLTGTPASAWLGPEQPGGRSIDLSERFSDWRQTDDRDQLRANISLIGLLLGPPRTWPEFARRELTLEDGVATASAAHAAKRVGRYAIALWRLRRGRRWVEPAL